MVGHLAVDVLHIFRIFGYSHLNKSRPVDRNKSQKCFLLFGSFLFSLSIHGGQCDNLRVDHEMNGNVKGSNMVLNVFHLSSTNSSTLTDQHFEIAQSLIPGMLALQTLGRGGSDIIYCVRILMYSIT